MRKRLDGLGAELARFLVNLHAPEILALARDRLDDPLLIPEPRLQATTDSWLPPRRPCASMATSTPTTSLVQHRGPSQGGHCMIVRPSYRRHNGTHYRSAISATNPRRVLLSSPIATRGPLKPLPRLWEGSTAAAAELGPLSTCPATTCTFPRMRPDEPGGSLVRAVSRHI